MPAPGMYWGKPIGARTEKSSTGNDMITVEFEVTHVASADGSHVPLPKPEKAFSQCSMSDKAQPYSIKRLQHLGFNGDFEAPDFQSDGTWLEHRQDGKYMKWEIITPRVEREPASKDSIMRLNALWRNTVGSTPPPPPPGPTGVPF